MRRIFLAAALTAAVSASAARAAEEWGIEGEKAVRFEARVVDMLCVITGDCPKDCGNGRRQLGLLRDDGTLLPVVKNFEPFAGATVELRPFCGRKVLADGLIIENDKARLFALQFVRPLPDGKWRRANRFGRAWAKSHPGKDPGQWFRHDERVGEIIARDGKLGIRGLKAE